MEIKDDNVDLYEPYPPLLNKDDNDRDDIIFENDIQIDIKDEDDNATPVDGAFNELKYM